MDETKALDQSLKGYKEQAPIVNKCTLTLDKDLIFVARTNSGYEIEFDANIQWGCSPTESLLMSIAGCMAIDVVSFLRKMRAEISKYSMDVTGERNPSPPQFYRKVSMVLNIAGKGLTPGKVDRAVSLSREKYCSVYHSLRKDLQVDVTYNITNEE